MTDEVADQTPENAETGDSGPGRFVENANGFLTFKAGLKSDATTEIDEAIKIPSEHIERAFINRWDRHGNVVVNRTHDVLRRQAYDLSFGDDEKKRIRESLPADADALDVIESFGEQILLNNFVRYLGTRRSYFRLLSFWVPLVSMFLVLLIGVVCWNSDARQLFFPEAWFGGVSTENGNPDHWETVWQTVRSGFWFSATFLVLAYSVVRPAFWYLFISSGLQTERTYYMEIIKGSTSRVKSYLSSIQRSFVSLSVSAQKQLTDIKKRDDDFVERAKKYVRLIVWFPVRLEMIEVFYRATIDYYMEVSAQRVLAADLGIFARRQLRFCAIATAALTTVGIVAATVAKVANEPLAAVAAVGIAVIGFALAIWPQMEAWSSARFIPREFSGFQFDVFRRRALGVLIGGLPAAGGGALLMWGASGLNAAQIWPAIVVLNAVVACYGMTQNFIAWWIYLDRETRKLYNGNVADTIILEMNSADWGAFNELRSDQKMAEIYESVFSALQEEKKARR